MPGIALSRDGAKLYRALPDERCVDIVELATGGVIGRIDLPGSPSTVAVSPDGRIALVAASKREPEGERGKGYVIDLSTNRLSATLPVGYTPLSAVFSPDGTRAYLSAFGSADWGGGTVSAFRTEDWLLIATIDVGEWARDVAVSPDGNRLFVATEFAGGSLAIVNARTNKLSRHVPGIGGNPTGVAVNLNGIQVYVASLSGKRVYIVDTATGTSSESIEVDMDPHGLVVNPYNAEMYVAHSISLGPPAGSIIVIDLATHQVKQRVEIVGGAGSMALSHDGTVLYCVDNTEDHICEFAVD
jgi:DNA-binding beta-propeller fold protein YncE